MYKSNLILGKYSCGDRCYFGLFYFLNKEGRLMLVNFNKMFLKMYIRRYIN